MRVRATLIKTVSDDGIVEMNDDVQLGKVYTADLQSIRVQMWGKSEDPSVAVSRFSIFIYDGAEALTGSWMPLEFLKLQTN